MTRAECTAFLRGAMPRLGLRWAGFRSVRGQVCKRLGRRLITLGLDDVGAYRRYLDDRPSEWRELERLCRVTVSRFYRDAAVFDALSDELLPALAARQPQRRLRLWSVGCASGEEPYTLALITHVRLGARLPGAAATVVGTDIDERTLARARRACYGPSSLRELPTDLLEAGFVRAGEGRCLRPELLEGVELALQDVRREAPGGRFDVVLCRNLAFTYYLEEVQREVLARLLAHLEPEGLLVIGRGERLPATGQGLEPWSGDLGIYRARSG